MSENDPSPIDPRLLEHGKMVVDVIMSPEETALLRSAKERGCLVHPGRAMLDGQLFEIFDFLTA
ncbi:hypothetical protein [Rhizobium jaguaris]|uniref:Uncharacterized protein n=1 Tax=Rhizobium jaguaris TaxID=1312183 RepID=A0A387G421_9HYPH|nr:hypothetical protein [Rhizobium jaguaris]AYG64105.1 hypothetical protein CCGE525_35490 [Rhizobium jaguaris]